MIINPHRTVIILLATYQLPGILWRIIVAKKLFLEESFSNLKYIGHWTVVSVCSEKLMSMGLGTFRIRLFTYLKVKR
jgi:hypothetical protein